MAGGAGEDWTASVRTLCRACSEENPDAGAHAHSYDDRWKASRTVGLATKQDESELQTLLSRWVAGRDRTALQRLASRSRRSLLSLRRVTSGAARG
jgi:hypothetical protein